VCESVCCQFRFFCFFGNRRDRKTTSKRENKQKNIFVSFSVPPTTAEREDDEERERPAATHREESDTTQTHIVQQVVLVPGVVLYFLGFFSPSPLGFSPVLCGIVDIVFQSFSAILIFLSYLCQQADVLCFVLIVGILNGLIGHYHASHQTQTSNYRPLE
jgi:hypothetical protein